MLAIGCAANYGCRSVSNETHITGVNVYQVNSKATQKIIVNISFCVMQTIFRNQPFFPVFPSKRIARGYYSEENTCDWNNFYNTIHASTWDRFLFAL